LAEIIGEAPGKPNLKFDAVAAGGVWIIPFESTKVSGNPPAGIM
jgi:hypothetical protein